MTGEPGPGDPVAALEHAAWALAAVIAVQREAAEGSQAKAMIADLDRAAVLEAAGLGGTSLYDGPATAHAAAAHLSSLGQAVDAAAGRPATGWAGQPDDVLLDQGRASAATGRAIATRLVPALADLGERLAQPGSRVLDVGAGVGALSMALVHDLPEVRVTAIDILERVLRLAETELGRAGSDAQRVELRRQDVNDLREHEAYELIWLPAPFIPDDVLVASLPHVVEAVVPGGWLIVGTNPAPADRLAAAVVRWQAHRNGGSATEAGGMMARLRHAGLVGVDRHPTMPGGPVLVVGQRPTRQ